MGKGGAAPTDPFGLDVGTGGQIQRDICCGGPPGNGPQSVIIVPPDDHQAGLGGRDDAIVPPPVVALVTAEPMRICFDGEVAEACFSTFDWLRSIDATRAVQPV